MSNEVPPKIEWNASHKAAPNQRSFLDLPRELRDLVYQFAFRVSGAIFIYSTDPYHVRRNARGSVIRNKNEGPVEPQPISKMIPIGLVRTCRQLYAEGIEVLYAHNVFRLYASNADFAPRYRAYVRHIIFGTDSMIQKIFDNDFAIVDYWWRRHFWPDILSKSMRLQQTYPELETLNFPIKNTREEDAWRPAFMASEHKTREQRINVAAAWLKVKCPFSSEKLRQCLQLEIVPSGRRSKTAYGGSGFEPEDKWDCSEFAEAFEQMKLSTTGDSVLPLPLYGENSRYNQGAI